MTNGDEKCLLLEKKKRKRKPVEVFERKVYIDIENFEMDK